MIGAVLVVGLAKTSLSTAGETESQQPVTDETPAERTHGISWAPQLLSDAVRDLLTSPDSVTVCLVQEVAVNQPFTAAACAPTAPTCLRG